MPIVYEWTVHPPIIGDVISTPSDRRVMLLRVSFFHSHPLVLAFSSASFNHPPAFMSFQPAQDRYYSLTVCSTSIILKLMAKKKWNSVSMISKRKTTVSTVFYYCCANEDDLNFEAHWFAAVKCHKYVLLQRRKWWGSRTLKLAFRLWHLTNNHLVKYNNVSDFVVFSTGRCCPFPYKIKTRLTSKVFITVLQ